MLNLESDITKVVAKLEGEHCKVVSDHSQDNSASENQWDFSIDCAWDANNTKIDKSYDFSIDCSYETDSSLSELSCSCDKSSDQTHDQNGSVDSNWEFDFSCERETGAAWTCD